MYSLRSSTLSRFMNCSGSVTLINPLQDDNDFAAEGTAAHELLERKFKGEDCVPLIAKNGVVFDEDMHYHAKTIAVLIPPHAKCETVIEYPVVTDRFKVTGTIDYVWEEDDGKTLVIADYKYGFRIVEPENNWQLISYAIGELSLRQKAYEKIVLRIIQPRPHHPLGNIRETVYTTEQILTFYQQLQTCAQNFLDGVVKFNTSDKCRYCPSLQQECPAINRAFYNAVDVVIYNGIQDTMDNKQLANMMQTFDRIKDVMKIKHEALQDLAKSRLRAGEKVGNYSLQPVYGHRQWTKDLDIDTIKSLSGFDLGEVKMMSPAQAEKKGLSADVVKSFTVIEQKGFSLTQVDETKIINNIFGKPEGV